MIMAAARLKTFGLTLLEFFLPRLCIFCGGAVPQEAAAAVCPECDGELDWVASPLCPCCGKVFSSREGPDHLCGDCQTEPPPFQRARAAVLYHGPAIKAITRFKYGAHMDCLPVLQSWLQTPPCRDLVATADLLVPVPLHPKRLKDRGFNQALLLAGAFPETVLSREALVRLVNTRPQVGLNPKQRRANVSKAFTVLQPHAVKGKNILLLDDLFTTGATVRECARALKRAGARRVEVLTVARVRYE
jgi:ComF family protein